MSQGQAHSVQTRRALLRRLLVTGGAAAIAPGSVAPGSVAPGSVAPGSVAPGSVAPGSVFARSVSPEPKRRDPFAGVGAFSVSVSVQASYVPAKEIVAQSTPDAFPFVLRVAPFDADTPVHLCAQNRPLRDVLQMIAGLLGGQWREENDAHGVRKSAFVLEPKPATLARERVLSEATDELALEPMRNYGQDALRLSYADWKTKWEQIIAAQPETLKNSWRTVPANPTPSAYAIARLVAQFNSAQRKAFVRRGYHVLPWERLTDAQQNVVLDAFVADGGARRLRGPGFDPIAARRSYRADLARSGAVLYLTKNAMRGTVRYFGLDIQNSWGIHAAAPSGNNADDFVLPVSGNPYRPNADAGPAAAQTAIKKDDKNAAFLYAPFPLPPDVDFDLYDTWADVVQFLAKHLPVRVASDAYTVSRRIEGYGTAARFHEDDGGLWKNLAKQTVAEALDALCSRYERVWWVEGGSLFFRGRAWFVEKRYETPASVAERVTALLRAPGNALRTVSVALVDSVTALTLEQIQGMMGRKKPTEYYFGPDIMRGSGAASSNRAVLWLHFWRGLSLAQKQKAVTPYGLPGTEITGLQKFVLEQNALAIGSGPIWYGDDPFFLAASAVLCRVSGKRHIRAAKLPGLHADCLRADACKRTAVRRAVFRPRICGRPARKYLRNNRIFGRRPAYFAGRASVVDSAKKEAAST